MGDAESAVVSFDRLFALGEGGGGQSSGGGATWSMAAAPHTDEKRLFGGLLLGQAVVAASAGGSLCHALHALFLCGGRKGEAFAVDVERIRDGRSFAARRVRIRQRDDVLFEALSSHHRGDSGPEYAAAMPPVPPPEALDDQRSARRVRAERSGAPIVDLLAERLLDARPIDEPVHPARGSEGRRIVWVRPRISVEGDAAVHRAAIAFASDLGLVPVGLLAHRTVGDGSRLDVTSLDHAMSFHRDASANDWLLQVQHGRVMSGGRGFARSSIFTRDGRLVASAAQEFLARTARGGSGSGAAAPPTTTDAERERTR